MLATPCPVISEGLCYSSGTLGVGTTWISGRGTAWGAGSLETGVMNFFLGFKVNGVKLDKKEGTKYRATLWAVENLHQVTWSWGFA